MRVWRPKREIQNVRSGEAKRRAEDAPGADKRELTQLRVHVPLQRRQQTTFHAFAAMPLFSIVNGLQPKRPC